MRAIRESFTRVITAAMLLLALALSLTGVNSQARQAADPAQSESLIALLGAQRTMDGSGRMFSTDTVRSSGSAARGQPYQEKILASLARIESKTGGTLGIHVLDTEDGRRIGFNDHSRFAMASTFKWLLAAAVLSRVDAEELSLQQRIPFGPEDVLAYAPVVSARLPEGALSIRELCAAVVEVSDNSAANLLLSLIGGPAGLTRLMRDIGDSRTRLDRLEPDLNSNVPGDVRDTSTPYAMVYSMQKLLTGDVLSPSSRAQLIEWLVSSRTGLQRLRAGLPHGWKVGDKTGTGLNGAVNDVAVVWPLGRKPVLIAVYMSGSDLSVDELNSAHAGIGELVGAWIKSAEETKRPR